MRSYDYARRTGVRELGWQECAELASTMAEQLAERRIDVVVGIARAGLLPATMVALSLRCELYPVRITRRVNDEVRFTTPVWRVPVSEEVAGHRVAVIDEMADTGESLEIVRQAVAGIGAAEVLAASLVAHSWASPFPAVTALTSDDLIIFPWDRRVLINGRWQPHPEIAAALSNP